MSENIKQWLKSSDSPFAKSLFQFAKSIRNPQMWVIPGIHSFIYKAVYIKTLECWQEVGYVAFHVLCCPQNKLQQSIKTYNVP